VRRRTGVLKRQGKKKETLALKTAEEGGTATSKTRKKTETRDSTRAMHLSEERKNRTPDKATESHTSDQKKTTQPSIRGRGTKRCGSHHYQTDKSEGGQPIPSLGKKGGGGRRASEATRGSGVRRKSDDRVAHERRGKGKETSGQAVQGGSRSAREREEQALVRHGGSK